MMATMPGLGGKYGGEKDPALGKMPNLVGPLCLSPAVWLLRMREEGASGSIWLWGSRAGRAPGDMRSHLGPIPNCPGPHLGQVTYHSPQSMPLTLVPPSGSTSRTQFLLNLICTCLEVGVGGYSLGC